MSVQPSCQDCHSTGRSMSELRAMFFLAVGEFPHVRPRQRLQVLKGAFGWTEAPRLWFLPRQPAGAEMRTCGVHETRAVGGAVCTRHDAAGKLRMLLTAQADDGLLLWKWSDPFTGSLRSLSPNSSTAKLVKIRTISRDILLGSCVKTCS